MALVYNTGDGGMVNGGLDMATYDVSIMGECWKNALVLNNYMHVEN